MFKELTELIQLVSEIFKHFDYSQTNCDDGYWILQFSCSTFSIRPFGWKVGDQIKYKQETFWMV